MDEEQKQVTIKFLPRAHCTAVPQDTGLARSMGVMLCVHIATCKSVPLRCPRGAVPRGSTRRRYSNSHDFARPQIEHTPVVTLRKSTEFLPGSWVADVAVAEAHAKNLLLSGPDLAR